MAFRGVLFSYFVERCGPFSVGIALRCHPGIPYPPPPLVSAFTRLLHALSAGETWNSSWVSHVDIWGSKSFFFFFLRIQYSRAGYTYGEAWGGKCTTFRQLMCAFKITADREIPIHLPGFMILQRSSSYSIQSGGRATMEDRRTAHARIAGKCLQYLGEALSWVNSFVLYAAHHWVTHFRLVTLKLVTILRYRLIRAISTGVKHGCDGG